KKDAELHAEEDRKRKELVEAKNNGDSMIHMTQKSLTELGDKVDAETKANVEREIEGLKKALEGDDIEAIKSATEKLTQASHKLAELMYAQASQQGGPEGGAAGGPGAGAAGAGAAGGAAGSSGGDDDDVVDADFEEVK
ncbi:MAG TPA: molecular chaperone DnaK, partial [Desulfobulbaceae bacterium]|nr:molecular chaperone DnaK [Desulfobulbaceae bacterium]